MSGALIGQFQGFADVGMGIGTIVIGLASVIIGEVVFGTKSFVRSLIAVVLGSIVYRIVIAAVLYMGMPPNDLKLFTAILVAIALSLPTFESKVVGSFKEDTMLEVKKYGKKPSLRAQSMKKLLFKVLIFV